MAVDTFQEGERPGSWEICSQRSLVTSKKGRALETVGQVILLLGKGGTLLADGIHSRPLRSSSGLPQVGEVKSFPVGIQLRVGANELHRFQVLLSSQRARSLPASDSLLQHSLVLAALESGRSGL